MIIRFLRVGGLLCLAWALSGCGTSDAPRANCFNFRDTPARSGTRAETAAPVDVAVTRGNTGCDFVRLGMGG